MSVVMYAGAAVAGMYNWAASLYAYNRDAWMTDTQVQQSHCYQMDNLRIAMQSMDREEVRDMMQADVTKINNTILVATLILSIAGEMMVEGRMSTDCAAFLLNAYMLCLGSAIFYLVLSILFGMFSSALVYRTSTNLLTRALRPAWESQFESMKDRQDKELVEAFDKKPLKAIFTPPLMSRCKEIAQGLRQVREVHTEEPGPVVQWHVAWEWQAQEWNAFTNCMFQCVAFGTKNLLDALGYLCVGSLYGSYREAWAFWAVQIVFMSLNVVVMQFLLMNVGVSVIERSRYYKFLVQGKGGLATFIIIAGPLSMASAVMTASEILDRICIPVCYCTHLLVTHFCSQLCKEAEMQHQEDTKDLKLPAELCEVIGEEETSLLDETRGGGIMHATFTRTGTVVTDPGLILETACLGGMHVEDHEESPDYAGSLLGPTMFEDCKLRPHLAGLCPAADDREFLQGELPAEGPECTRRCQEEIRRRTQSSDGPRLGRQLSRGERARRVPTSMLLCGMSIIRLLWSCALIWAVYGSIFGMDFKNDKAMAQWLPAGPPVANIEPLAMLPPSPYFKPHSITCPRGRVFLADEFHVFELDSVNSQVELFECAVNGTIADLTARCEGETCWPVVLLKGSPPAVLDCGNGVQSPLLQTNLPAKALAARASGALDTVFAAHENDIIEYRWSPIRHGWEPWWRVMQDPGGIKAVDVTSDQLLVFHEQGTLEAQDYQTGTPCGVWQLPKSLIGAGCAVNGSTSVLVLVPETRLRGPGARLMRATLPQTHNSDNCRHLRDENVFGRVSDG